MKGTDPGQGSKRKAAIFQLSSQPLKLTSLSLASFAHLFGDELPLQWNFPREPDSCTSLPGAVPPSGHPPTVGQRAVPRARLKSRQTQHPSGASGRSLKFN